MSLTVFAILNVASLSLATALPAIKLTHNHAFGVAEAQIGHGCPPSYRSASISVVDTQSTFFNERTIPFTPCRVIDSPENYQEVHTLVTLQVPDQNITFHETVQDYNINGTSYGNNQELLATGGPVDQICANFTNKGVGVFIPPPIAGVEGEAMFCGTNPSIYYGSLIYTNTTVVGGISTTPLTNAVYGTRSIMPSIPKGQTALAQLLTNSVGISFGLSAYPDLWNAYLNATGATGNNINSQLTLTEAQFAALQPLHLTLGCCKTVTLIPDAQINPRASPSDPIVLASSPSHQYPQLILGDTFLQRYYVDFNTRRHQLGFATHKYTSASYNY